MTRELPKVYEPQQVESEIYKMWEEGGYFAPSGSKEAKPFTIVMPPPNVTGQLHMGHAMDATLQDTLIRFKRMQGYNALWLPGVDHAGIATQIKVEEELRKEGLTRYDLGREKFLERVWDWKHKYGNRIVEQQKKLGASCDWGRARFTMDEGCSNAVREVFVSLYEKGLIYKGSRIINWCPNCVTALSDAEVEYVDKPGHLWHIRYPLADGTGEVVTFGIDKNADVYADNIRFSGAKSMFDLYAYGDKVTDVTLHVPGMHNIRNALAAAAASLHLGIKSIAIKYGLAGFIGAGRRFEYKGKYNGADVYDDYAHHPGELQATLDAVQQLGYKRNIVVFQPHTYTRTAALFDDFVTQLKRPDITYLAEIYAAREVNTIGISSKDICREINGAKYFATFEEIVADLRKFAQPGDIILTIGAGDVYKIGEALVEK